METYIIELNSQDDFEFTQRLLNYLAQRVQFKTLVEDLLSDYKIGDRVILKYDNKNGEIEIVTEL